MSKYKRSVELAVSRLRILKELGAEWCQPVIADLHELEDIADRLEQADFTKHKKHYRDIEDSKWDVGYEIGFVNGYSQALADVRGDTE